MNRAVEVANLITMGSIEEYRAINGPQFRAAGRVSLSPWSYPCRGFVGCGLKDLTQVVLPDVPPVREFVVGIRSIWEELEIIEKRASLPVIWVDDPLIRERDTLDRVILDDIDSFRKQLLAGRSIFLITPQTNTPELSQWRELLKKDYGIKTEVIMANKPYEYPNIFDRSGFADFAQRHNLPIPYSRVAVNKGQLVEAYEDVSTQSDNKTVWAKLAASGGGYGISRMNSAAEVEAFYEKLSDLGVLKLYGKEIPWEIQADIDNIVALCSWQYHGDRIITPGGFSLQYTDPRNSSIWIGNGYNIASESVPPDIIDSIVGDLETKTTMALKEELGPNHNHMGGFDFAITRNEQANYNGVILEHNGARMSDSVMQVEAARLLGIKDCNPFAVIKLGSACCSIADVWQLLKGEHFAYDLHRRQGVIPFVWLEEKKGGYASVIITASSSEQLTKLYDSSVNSMRKEGMVN